MPSGWQSPPAVSESVPLFLGKTFSILIHQESLLGRTGFALNRLGLVYDSIIYSWWHLEHVPWPGGTSAPSWIKWDNTGLFRWLKEKNLSQEPTPVPGTQSALIKDCDGYHHPSRQWFSTFFGLFVGLRGSISELGKAMSYALSKCSFIQTLYRPTEVWSTAHVLGIFDLSSRCSLKLPGELKTEYW